MNFLLSVNIDNVNRKCGISGKMTFSFHFNHWKINNKKCTGHWIRGNVDRLSRQKTIKQRTLNYHFLIVRGKILWCDVFIQRGESGTVGGFPIRTLKVVFLVSRKETICDAKDWVRENVVKKFPICPQNLQLLTRCLSHPNPQTPTYTH